MTRSIMICKGCGIKKYSFQSFNMQIFELKYLKEKKVLHIQNNEKLNLIEAFLLQQMPELLTNENKIYCNNCKGLADGVHQQSIYQLPKVLIIILNRGRNIADFTEEFDFPVILDLRNQNIIIDKNSPHLFYLCGKLHIRVKVAQEGILLLIAEIIKMKILLFIMTQLFLRLVLNQLYAIKIQIMNMKKRLHIFYFIIVFKKLNLIIVSGLPTF